MEGSLYLNSPVGNGALVSAEAAWRGLAVLADWSQGRPGGAQLAQRLGQDRLAAQSALGVRNYLHEILVDARDDPDGPAVAGDVAEFLSELPAPLLSAVLRAEIDEHKRSSFLEAAAQRLPIPVLKRVAAGLASAYERPYPMSVRASIHTLASAATAGEHAATHAEPLLRETIRRLFHHWVRQRRTAVTQGFEPVLEKLERRQAGRSVPEAERILEMAIECDSQGEVMWVALQEVVEDGGTARVIDLIKTAPEEAAVAAAIMKRIGKPQELRNLLRAEPLNGAAVDALLRGMGIAAANVLLEELVESTARLTRRYLMERLARFGTEIQPLVEGRLKDQRWFVQRNMLALMRNAKCVAEPATAGRFLAHRDARVRREAVLWCLESQGMRDEALVAALGDRDVAVLRPALQSARSQLPTLAVPVLAKRALDADFPPEFRVLALSLLGRSGSALALEALLHFAQNGKTLLGKPRLAHKSPEMLAAVSSLARAWPGERRAHELLSQARKSRDREVADAASGKTGAEA